MCNYTHNFKGIHMFKKAFHYTFVSLTLLTGLFFMSNIYVLGNTPAAIAMHDDLPRDANALTANTKVIICFITGALFAVTAVGIFRKKYKASVSGVIGCILFDGFYIFQLIMWSDQHPRMWIDFAVFGSICMLLGVFSWFNFRKRPFVKDNS